MAADWKGSASRLGGRLAEDHKLPSHGQIDDCQFDLISYAECSHFHGGSSDLIGIGAYLGEVLRVHECAGSAALAGDDRSRWSSSSEGVSCKIRIALRDELESESPEAADFSVDELRPFLAHDLLWLCICIYRHIAGCNHHQEEARNLSDFRDRLRELHNSVHPSASGSQSAEPKSDGWPIRDASDRRCPLTIYLPSPNPAAAAAAAAAQQGSDPT